MYHVFCDGAILFDPRDEETLIASGTVTLPVNDPGEFLFTLPPVHKCINMIEKLKSVISVYEEDELLFKGRVIDSETDIYNSVTYTCEGELAYLADSIQRPKKYSNLTPESYLRDKIAQHNSQVETEKQFEIGKVEIQKMNYAAREDEQYTNTLDTIADKLISSNGGYLRVRYRDEIRILDYLKDYNRISTQVLRFGQNILNLTEHINATEVKTVLIPLGGTIEDSEDGERVTIASVNNGKDYLEDLEAIALYGRIVGTQTWDDVTIPANLKTKGQEYLKNSRNLSMTIELTAIDLHLIDVDIDCIKLGDMVRVESKPHGIDRYMLVSKREYNLLKPSEDKISLGDTIGALTEKQLAMQKEVDKQKDAAASDKSNISLMIFGMSAQMTQLGMDSSDIKQRVQSLETEIEELNESDSRMQADIQDILKRLETLEASKEEGGETS